MVDEHNQITHCNWGKEKQVTVRLDNRFKVNEKLLKRIFKKANLPKCRLFLKLDTNEAPTGFACRAMAFLRDDLDIILSDDNAMVEGLRRDAIRQKNIDAPKDDWQYGVYIPGVTAELWTELPACFAFYVLHELEHVRIMLHDPNFHRFASWTWEHWPEFFPEGKLPKWNRWNWPWELHCNKESKRLAIEMYGKEPFIEALSCQIKKERPKHEEHAKVLGSILTLPCGAKEDNLIDSLKRKIQTRIDKEGVRSAIYSKWRLEARPKLASRFNLQDFL
ncbi:MAG: hypothetical protein ACYS3N_21200 [Planctomycetota bacterium]|jgi:hypothetical protein